MLTLHGIQRRLVEGLVIDRHHARQGSATPQRIGPIDLGPCWHSEIGLVPPAEPTGQSLVRRNIITHHLRPGGLSPPIRGEEMVICGPAGQSLSSCQHLLLTAVYHEKPWALPRPLNGSIDPGCGLASSSRR